MSALPSPHKQLAMIVWTVCCLCLVMSGRARAEPAKQKVVSLSWEAVPGATSYELQILHMGAKGYEPTTEKPFNLTKTSWAGPLRPGLYQLQVRSLDRRGVPGPWGDPAEFTVRLPPVQATAPKQEEVLPGAAEEVAVTFSWDGYDDALGYELTILGSPGFPERKLQTEAEDSEQRLPAAATYRWRVRAIGSEHELGEDSGVQRFTLRGPRLATPTKLAMSSNDEEQRLFSWQRPAHAQAFKVRLSKRRQDQTWRRLGKYQETSSDSWRFEQELKPGDYRFDVIASGELRADSPVASYTFSIARPKKAAANHTVRPPMQIEGAYLPRLWRHSAKASDQAGVSFAVFAFTAYQLGASYWWADHTFGVALRYEHWSATLFDRQVDGGDSPEQHPLQLNGQAVTLRANVERAWSRIHLGIAVGVRRDTSFFLYKDTPATVNVVSHAGNSLVGGAYGCLQLGASLTLEGAAEQHALLPIPGLSTLKQTESRVDGALRHRFFFSGMTIAYLYELDYKSVRYNSSGIEGSGDFKDVTNAVGVGLRYEF